MAKLFSPPGNLLPQIKALARAAHAANGSRQPSVGFLEFIFLRFDLRNCDINYLIIINKYIFQSILFTKTKSRQDENEKSNDPVIRAMNAGGAELKNWCLVFETVVKNLKVKNIFHLT